MLECKPFCYEDKENIFPAVKVTLRNLWHQPPKPESQKPLNLGLV